MKRIFYVCLVAIVLLMTAGCGYDCYTRCHKARIVGDFGYWHEPIKPNHYHIVYTVCPSQSEAMAREKWMRVACELCAECGCTETRPYNVVYHAGNSPPSERPSMYKHLSMRAEAPADLVGRYPRVTGYVECLQKSE
jgi:hypothetical protein